MWPGTRSKRANPPAIRRRRTLPLTCCDNQRRILRQLRLAQQGRKLQGRPQGKKADHQRLLVVLRNGPSPLSKTGAVIPMRQVEATMIGASLNGPGCFPFLKAGWDGPPVHAGGFPSVVMIEAARRGRPLFLQRLLLFVYALLYGTRFFGSAGVVRPGCGICAGSAGVAAG